MSSNPSESWPSNVFEAGMDTNWKENIDDKFIDLDNVKDDIKSIIFKVLKGTRITIDEGVKLHDECDLPTLANIANKLKLARFSNYVFFNRNLHVNQTNVCVLACKFCAFREGPKSDEAYSLSIEEYLNRIEPYKNHISEVHTVGGLHNEWTIEYYTSLFSATKEKYPHLQIKALTAVEIKHLAIMSGLEIHDVLKKLKNSGLDSIPGGGAEILDDEVRNHICKGKESSNEYLSIHKAAHELGIPTNCTMLFGTIETTRQRIVHMDKLRLLQDQTNGFQCFVPYPFLPDKTRLPEAQLATANEILRTVAMSRIMLDNIPHIKSYRMNLGDDISALALLHGADDIDGTVSHEEIMHKAGSTTPLDQIDADLANLIEQIGGVPVERNTDYTIFRKFRKLPPSDNKGLPVAYG